MTTAIIPTAGEVSVNSTEQQFADCIKTESDFVDMKYHNICTGEVSVVPTGVFSYMAFGLFIVLLFFLLAMAVKVIRN